MGPPALTGSLVERRVVDRRPPLRVVPDRGQDPVDTEGHPVLADPRQLSRSIQTIAARWAFSDPAHFSRVFRAAHGMTPRDYRHYAQHRFTQESTSAVHG
ncbi:helix-turn-helix domain-containing protein [Streptomyces sp. LZ34]